MRPWYNNSPLIIIQGELTIQPVYYVGVLGGATLNNWINSTTTSFSKVETEPNDNRAVVRLILTVNSQAPVLFYQSIYTITDFFAGLVCTLFRIS